MTRLPAIGNGPVVYVTKNGTRVVLPLSLVYFENGVVGTSRPPDQYSSQLKKLLDYLWARGELKPGNAKPLVTVLRAIAKPPGVSGNKVEVKVVEATDKTKVNITARQIDLYPAVTLATLEQRLDDDLGLLKVKTLPGTAGDPTGATDVKITADKAVVTITTATDDVVLEGRTAFNGLNKNNFTVEVLDFDATAKAFTLKVTWEREVKDVAVSDLATAATIDTKLKPLGYVVEFALPDTGATGKVPRPDAVALTGGRKAAPAVSASSYLLASSS